MENQVLPSLGHKKGQKLIPTLSPFKYALDPDDVARSLGNLDEIIKHRLSWTKPQGQTQNAPNTSTRQ